MSQQVYKKQVFSTNSPKRWDRIKWASRIFIVIAVVFTSIVTFSLLFYSQKPTLPTLFNKYNDYKTAILNDTISNEHNTATFDYINNKKGIKPKGATTLSKRLPIPFDKRMRAAFYVNWDLQSFYSLRTNVTHMNTILPEWLHVPDKADTVYTDIDNRALTFLNAHPGVQVIPMITNYFNNKWDGENVLYIARDAKRRLHFIQSVLNLLEKYHFQGVNIDFESLESNDAETYLTIFQNELYTALHAKGYLVSQDVNAQNSDYNLPKLSEYNDYIFVMAYDLHNAESTPGDIAPQKWVEGIIADVSKQVPPEKLILCIAGYGYDWGKDPKHADEITFQECIAIAKESDAKIEYSNETYNLKFNYTDENGKKHYVGFTDAASNFNTMRLADDAGWKGVALWRLGSEDPRLWSFYNRNLSEGALDSSDFKITDIKNALLSSTIDYIGEGEALDVITEPKEGKVNLEYEPKDKLITEENFVLLPTSFVVRKFGKADAKKKVLTFDDGPDPEWTPQILDILQKEKVPAAFFMVGYNAESNLPLLRKIDKLGYEIGNHSFFHPNMATIPEWRSIIELNTTRRLIESIIGKSTILFRPPYLADAEPETEEELLPVVIAKKQNYITIGESIDPLDWDAKNINADSIVDRVIREKDYGAMILLHDAGGDRSATVAALPRIIKYFKDNGYTFTTIADVLQEKPEKLMPPLIGKQAFLDKFDRIFAEVGYFLQSLFGGIFVFSIILSVFRNIVILVLAFLQRQKNRRAAMLSGSPDFATVKLSGSTPFTPPISVIVPAYNEEVTAIKTINSLLLQDYPNFEIIFVDDGSKDKTYEKVKAAFENDARVKIYTKLNGGKASALNFGIAQTQNDFVVNIDADTQLSNNALHQLIQKMSDDNIVAVAGNVQVGNKINVLTRWQAIEYTTAQNFDRLAMEYLNAITVIPGAIGAFRVAAIKAVGGYDTDTLAEDCDLTIRLLRTGGKIGTANDAIAYTEAPETFAQFLKQRFRWNFGVLQAFWKNRDVLFDSKYKSLAWVAMPQILVFQLILPIFAPVADFVMIISILTGTFGKIWGYYLAFIFMDLISAFFAYRFEGKNMSDLWLLFPQRLVYRPLMYSVLYKTYRRAIKGELQEWGVLKRTGNVKNDLKTAVS